MIITMYNKLIVIAIRQKRKHCSMNSTNQNSIIIEGKNQPINP